MCSFTYTAFAVRGIVWDPVNRFNHTSRVTVVTPTIRVVRRYNEIVYKIAFSLYSSLLSIRFFEMGRSNKFLHRFRLFFKHTILLLIHRQFLQLWNQCIKKNSIYRIIGKLSPQHTVWPLNSDTSSISQSPRATSLRRHSLMSFGISLNRRAFPFSEFKGHRRRLTFPIGGNRRIFRVLRRQFGGKLPIMW